MVVTGEPTEVLYYTVSLIVIFTNVISIPAFFYLKSIKRSTLIFLMSLTLSVVLNGVSQLLVAVFASLKLRTFTNCAVKTLLSVASVMSYAFNMLFLYLDLYLTIERLSVSGNVLSTKMACVMTTSGWMLSSIVSFGMLFARSMDTSDIPLYECTMFHGSFVLPYYRVIVSLIVSTAMLLTTGLLVATIHSLKRHYRTVMTIQLNQATTLSQPLYSKLRWLSKKASTVKLLILVLLAFVIAWYPTMVTVLVAAVCDACVISDWLRLVLVVLPMLQNLTSPLVYLWRSKEVRGAYRRVLHNAIWKNKKCCSTPKVEPQPVEIHQSV